MTDDAGGKFKHFGNHWSKSNGMCLKICENDIFLSVLRRKFVLFSTQKVTVEKQKLRPFLVNFLGNSSRDF